MCCRRLVGFANPAYLSRSHLSVLHVPAPCCVPGGVSVLSIDIGRSAWALEGLGQLEVLGRIEV